MRLVFFLFMLLAIDLYAFQAIRLLIQHWSPAARQWAYFIYWLAPAIGAGLLLLAQWAPTSSWPPGLFTTIRALFFIIYLSKFLVAGVLLLDDVRRVLTAAYQALATDQAVNVGRNRFMTKLALYLGGIPLFLLTYGMARNPYRYQVFRKKLPISGLPGSLEGLRIVQISDIHSGSLTQPEAVVRAVELINAQDADLILFTGDLVNNRTEEMEPLVEIFSQLKSRYGVYSVLGNHDYGDYVAWPSPADKARNFEQMKAMHRRLGWNLLLNENRVLNIKGETVAIIGVENYSMIPRFPRHGDLPKAYQGAQDASLQILLSHDPTHWQGQVVDQYPRIQVTLSGHTHGMQFGVEIPGWFQWSPAQYMYKQWAGAYRQGAQWLYVNRGLGFLGYPGRVGILPEVTLLELTGEDLS